MSSGLNKRGQITIFVIAGIILLLIVALFFFLRKQASTVTPGGTGATIDLQLMPVQSFITNCLYSVGKQGVFKLGAHGGYIEPEKFGIISNMAMPTESNGVSFFEDSEPIAYWFYLKSNNKCQQNCVVASERPPLSDGDKSITSQLSTYIEENIGTCLNNLSSFNQTYGISAQIIGSPKAEVYIKDDTVLLLLKQTIKASYKDKQQTLTDFQTELPVRLKAAYEAMNWLLYYASDPDTRLFDKKTMYIIGAYGLGKNPSIPPIGGGMELGSDANTWQVSSVNREIRAILEDHMSLFTVDQTRNSFIVITPDPIFNGMYTDFVIDNKFLSTPEDYSIDFAYLQDWPIYVNVNPSKGGVIVIENTKIPLFNIPISVKEASYDISYPIIITINDHESFGGEGYVFQAAIEVNVRANEPLNISGESPLATGESTSLFCDYNQRKSGDITVTLTSTEPPVPEDVIISYECGDESCFMGSTSTGVFTSKFPLCAEGLVTASKEDYYSKPVKLSIAKDNPASINLEIEPYKELNVEIKKVVLTKLSGSGVPTSWVLDLAKTTDLGPDDKATIVLSRTPGAGEPDVVESVQVNGKNLNEPKTIKLISGDYAIAGFIATNLGPDSESKKVITLTDPNTGESITLDSLLYTGELTLDETTSGIVSINPDHLSTGKVTFLMPYVDVNDITSIDDLASYQDAITQLSISNKADLLPSFG